MSFLTKYDEIEKSTDKKFKFQDGIYKVMLEKQTLDLENKYGPTVSMMLRHKNNSVSWINAKIVNENPFVLKNVATSLGFEDALREVIKTNDTNANAVIEGFSKLLEPYVGKYYSATFKTGAKGYQNIYLNSESTKSEFDSYEMPKMIAEDKESSLDDALSSPPLFNASEPAPF